MCGSSARKLKRGGTNLLGGRAWRYEMHPLVSAEVGDLDLLRSLNRGLVPAHYLDAEHERSLAAYLVDYLKQEVFDEGLTRNVAAFSRFFDAVGFSHGDLTNYANIARVLAHRSYRDLGYGVHFWRTKTGLEVDFVLGDADAGTRVSRCFRGGSSWPGSGAAR